MVDCFSVFTVKHWVFVYVFVCAHINFLELLQLCSKYYIENIRYILKKHGAIYITLLNKEYSEIMWLEMFPQFQKICE